MIQRTDLRLGWLAESKTSLKSYRRPTGIGLSVRCARNAQRGNQGVGQDKGLRRGWGAGWDVEWDRVRGDVLVTTAIETATPMRTVTNRPSTIRLSFWRRYCKRGPNVDVETKGPRVSEGLCDIGNGAKRAIQIESGASYAHSPACTSFSFSLIAARARVDDRAQHCEKDVICEIFRVSIFSKLKVAVSAHFP